MWHKDLISLKGFHTWSCLFCQSRFAVLRIRGDHLRAWRSSSFILRCREERIVPRLGYVERDAGEMLTVLRPDCFESERSLVV